MADKVNYRQKMAEQTRQTVIETAIGLFHEHGYEHVTINDIVNRTGMTRGSFYAHFKDKDDLLCSSVFEDLDDDYLEYYNTVLRSMEEGGESETAVLKAYILKVNELLTKNGANLLRHYYGYTIAQSEILLKEKRHYLDILDNIIGKCRMQGLINNIYSDAQLRERIMMLQRSIAIEWAMRDGQCNIDNWNYLIDALIKEISV